MAGLLFPIGHYLGRLGPTSHLVRVGGNGVELRSEAALRVWQLTHGLVTDGTPWTRTAVLGLAAAAGVPGPRQLLDGLIRTGVVAEVEPDSEAAARFAGSYRLVPLLAGVPELPKQPDAYRLGMAGQPALTVDEWTRTVWAWGPLADNLWELSIEYAALTAPDEDADPVDTPQTILGDVLVAIRTLLAGSAAYLDLAVRVPAK